VGPTSEKDLAPRRKRQIDAGMRTWHGSRINDTTLAELVTVLNRPEFPETPILESKKEPWHVDQRT
jgi:hypothetical protein